MPRHTNLVVFAICLFVATSAGALVSPRDGGPMPQAFRDLRAKDPAAFTMKRAWIQKAQRIKQQRERYLAEQLANGPGMISALPSEYAVSGTIQVPVFLCAFNNVAAVFDEVDMQNNLFDDPTNTITDYYDEVSYGNLTMTGTVYSPVQLLYNDTYYEGGCQGIFCLNGHVGGLIKEILDNKDPFVDFGIYDNDGPDGIPNSGDDDGYVDFVAFVHPESGGECGNSNLWSHNWSYEGWAESGDSAYATNDVSMSGGYIKVNEYTLQPARSCDNTSIIEIGVFCHEFGHALGLPDLYDWDGGPGNGIGHWGIMGSGNWNTPESPAHPCAWTRMEMGWITPTDISWQGTVESITQIAESGQAFRLGFTNEQLRRTSFCAINGNFSFYCGLDSTEGFSRGWGAASLNQGGYGNNWRETAEREFAWDGTTPVSFTYSIRYDTEPAYDNVSVLIDIDGTETELQSYTGIGTVVPEQIDLSGYFSGLTPPVAYKLKFRGVSDEAWSDDDGGHNTLCGMFVVDDISVTGGGESYSTDFETSADGWYKSRAVEDRQEFWLVENRQPFGYDQHLHGTGLLVMHVDQHIMHSPELNSSDSRLRGLLVEEADGNYNLNQGLLNKGDDGDAYPGSSDNRTFDSNSWPWSKSNNGHDTQIEMSGISNSGPTMSVFVRAGDPGPAATAVEPAVVDNDQVAVDLAITGTEIQHDATFYLVFNSPAPSAAGDVPRAPADAEDIVPLSIRWVDQARLEGTVNVYSKTGGSWDLVVTNPDGQQATLVSAITINQLVATQFQSAAINVVDGDIRLEYVLFDREPDETIRLSRSLFAGAQYRVIAEDLEPASDNRYVYVDEHVEAGRTYYYKLEVVTPGEGARELHRGSATVPAGQLTLAQNFPNPFNPTTSISFFLPERTRVRLEVYDVAGRLVTRLAEGIFSAGPHSVNWQGVNATGSPVGSGVYVYRLVAGKQIMSRKMLLLK
jgi:M6 family metalloprotease-like protein